MEGLGPPLVGRDAEAGDGGGGVDELPGFFLKGEAGNEVVGSGVVGEGSVAEWEGGGLRGGGLVACMLLGCYWEG